MESADSADRKWACVAVSNLIQNDPSTRRLFQGKNVVGALIIRLTDGEEEVVVEACGALRCAKCNVPLFIVDSDNYTGICALMEDTIYVLKCIIRTY
jgi:hypothetical protein